jgi:hypothetical protein
MLTGLTEQDIRLRHAGSPSGALQDTQTAPGTRKKATPSLRTRPWFFIENIITEISLSPPRQKPLRSAHILRKSRFYA